MCLPARELVERPPRGVRQPRRRANRQQRLGFTGIVSAAVTLACTAVAVLLIPNLYAARPELKLDPPARASASVRILNARALRSAGFVTVTGNFRSQAPRPLYDLEAVVELLDSRQRTLVVEDSLVPFSPVRPGDAAPFQVEVQDAPQAVAYRVSFRELSTGIVD